MWHTFSQESDFNHELEMQAPLNDLPRIAPCFFVPPLENKPQNPIMESLKLEKMNMNMPLRYFQSQLPPELAVLTMDTAHIKEEQSATKIEELWNNAVTRKLGIKNGILSWDRLRPSHSDRASTTAFLSEQDDLVCASARSYVQPRLVNPMNSMLYVTQNQLLVSLKMIVLGFSSQYHMWDPAKERFIQVGTEQNGKRGFVLIDGKDEVVSESLISRFLKIGTLLRRLESLLSSLRTRSAKEGPTIHALAHSLSTTIDYLREVIASCPPSKDQLTSDNENLPLLSIWSQHAVYEDILVALADLYGRNEDLSPHAYLSLESAPVPLLSRLYEHLSFHFEHGSFDITCAIIAFILTSTSQEYIQDIARSVGFGGQPSQRVSQAGGKRNGEYSFDLEEEEEEEEDIFDLLDKIETSFPAFFPPKVMQALPAAQKSLILFQIAQPDHSLVASTSSEPSIRWLWTTEEITAAWNDLPLLSSTRIPLPITTTSAPLPSTSPYKPELSEFQMFDLEPGTSIPQTTLQVKDRSYIILCAFIDKFPASLPSITPTLSELTSLTFKGLLEHASTLSASLLALFINSPGILNFRSHLILLRSYLLIAAPPFKSRLLNALFSDAGEYEIDTTAHSMSIRSLRQRQGKKVKENKQPWAVGLSLNLLERETWPPVGADLSFFLRTVIVDSLESGKETDEGKVEREQVIEEAEWRLGFAIRDLPTGAGRDKWLDPLSIEALDFLYMDYKPPNPLEILISPDVLSKYQRMFAFILRLLRVESALKSLFRMSTHRAIATFLFPTLTQSRKLLLHFRFVVQAFVSSLSGYVFDTAIGGNFDPFLARLSPDGANPSSSDPSSGWGANESSAGFSDVFELAQRHSALLDDILSACLLRSGQRGVGDLLRQCLELVLEFTIVVGELHRGRIQEYQAAPMVEELFRKFCVKMTTFTKVLKGLVDKSPSSSILSLETYSGTGRRPTGGLDALYHLLVRLDLTDWWSKSTKQ
ncbi:gamma-tubulin complex, DGRIP91/SPC98 component protein [Flammula alnicola]|nr:gamma-tubulin complex, DGRIP91/SPC98 component protein [Flammula alnicola]